MTSQACARSARVVSSNLFHEQPVLQSVTCVAAGPKRPHHGLELLYQTRDAFRQSPPRRTLA